ncbi:MAG: iron-containing alcohol dehydrogenase [Myxococcota bacterium]|nr:iron-containing alcohol dehydrogenase [Myxococcota bacterium]
MSKLKRFAHNCLVPIGSLLARFLPDKVPITFVGVDSTRELCESIAQMQIEKVLVVTDSVLVELGLVQKVSECLERSGVASVTYDGVLPDPTFTQVEQGLTLLDEHGCQAVLALGGGSPMDASKLIAAMATNRVPIEKLEGMMKVKNAPMPLFAMPTTSGTGSEVTLAAVISDPVSHKKKFFTDPKLLPLMVALDPSLTLGLPPAITAATGMDALTHAIESYISKTATETTRGYAKISVKLVFDNLDRACQDGKNIETRRAMSLASYYGGLAFTRTSVGYVHAIAHTLGSYYKTPHGLANAIALPNVLEFSLPACEAQLAELADDVGIKAESQSRKAKEFIAAIRQLMKRIAIPFSLEDLRPQDIPAIAQQALAEAHLNYPVPRYMLQGECEALLHQILSD